MVHSGLGGSKPIEAGAVIAGRYVVREQLARGGASVLYRVEHVHTGELLAMKVLGDSALSDPEAMARFKQEIRTSSRIRSENVVLVTDADTAPELGGAPFMVMELLRGADLEAHAQRRGALSPESVAGILGQIVSVLEHAHRLGIVHRDLKPENVFMHERADGTTITKVLDFGISKFTAREGTSEGLSVTSTGAVLGTPLYMAPEQAHGHNDEIGPATDIWAVGLIALRLLAGEHYWGRPTMAELMMKITTVPIVPPSKRWPESKVMTPALDAWFLRSCERDHMKRWSSVGEQLSEFVRAVRAAEAAEAEARQPSAEAEVATPRSFSRGRLALGGALALIAAGAGAAAWSGNHREAALQGEPVPTVSSLPVAMPVATEPVAVSAAPSETAVMTAPKLLPSEAPRVRSAQSAAPMVRAPAPANSSTACQETEVLSSGHCCPSGHVWQSGRCARPVATSF